MPERIFKYHTTEDLITGVKDLAQLLTSGTGATNALRNSATGFLKQTGPVTQQQIRDFYMLGRYEIWLRGQGTDGNEPDPICASLETANPYQEKKMRVRSIYNPSEGWAFPPANINCP